MRTVRRDEGGLNWGFMLSLRQFGEGPAPLLRTSTSRGQISFTHPTSGPRHQPDDRHGIGASLVRGLPIATTPPVGSVPHAEAPRADA